MTKKDYIKIADILRDNKPTWDHEALHCWNGIVIAFEIMLQADNPNFNRETFINYINK